MAKPCCAAACFCPQGDAAVANFQAQQEHGWSVAAFCVLRVILMVLSPGAAPGHLHLLVEFTLGLATSIVPHSPMMC